MMVPATLFLAAALTSDGERLQLDLEQGHTYYLRTVIEQRVVVTGDDGERVTNSTIGTGLAYEVLERDDDGVHTLRVTYDWIRMRSDQPGAPIDFDSARSAEPATRAAVHYAAQVGRSFVLEMNSKGRVLALDGVPEMHERMAERITELGGRGEAYVPAIRRQFSEESLRDGLSLVGSVLPDAPVEVGESWADAARNTAGLARTTDSTYRLRSVKDGRAEIEVDTKIAPSERPRGATQWLEVDGTDRGLYRVDVATGWILTGATEQRLAGTTHARRRDGEIVSKITIESTTRITASRAPPTGG